MRRQTFAGLKKPTANAPAGKGHLAFFVDHGMTATDPTVNPAQIAA